MRSWCPVYSHSTSPTEKGSRAKSPLPAPGIEDCLTSSVFATAIHRRTRKTQYAYMSDKWAREGDHRHRMSDAVCSAGIVQVCSKKILHSDLQLYSENAELQYHHLRCWLSPSGAENQLLVGEGFNLTWYMGRVM